MHIIWALGSVLPQPDSCGFPRKADAGQPRVKGGCSRGIPDVHGRFLRRRVQDQATEGWITTQEQSFSGT